MEHAQAQGIHPTAVQLIKAFERSGIPQLRQPNCFGFGEAACILLT
jgi:hypothetical protein